MRPVAVARTVPYLVEEVVTVTLPAGPPPGEVRIELVLDPPGGAVELVPELGGELEHAASRTAPETSPTNPVTRALVEWCSSRSWSIGFPPPPRDSRPALVRWCARPPACDVRCQATSSAGIPDLPDLKTIVGRLRSIVNSTPCGNDSR